MQAFRLIACGVLVAGVGASARPAGADGLSDTLPAEVIGSGEAARAQASGTAAPWLNPAGAAMTQSYSVSGAYGYRSEDSAQIVAGAVCDSVTSKLGTCASYNFVRVGEAEDGQTTLHGFGLTLAVPVADLATIGVTGRYVNYEETGVFLDPSDDSRDGGFVMDAGTVVRLGASGLALAGVGYNLVGADAANFPRAVGAGLAWGSAGTLSISGDAVWNLQAGEDDNDSNDAGTGRYGVGASYLLTGDGGQQGYPIRLGYVYDHGQAGAQYLTAGLGLITPRIGVDLAMRKQIGGESTEGFLIQIGLRFFLPEPGASRTVM